MTVDEEEEAGNGIFCRPVKWAHTHKHTHTHTKTEPDLLSPEAKLVAHFSGRRRISQGKKKEKVPRFEL